MARTRVDHDTFYYAVGIGPRPGIYIVEESCRPTNFILPNWCHYLKTKSLYKAVHYMNRHAYGLYMLEIYDTINFCYYYHSAMRLFQYCKQKGIPCPDRSVEKLDIPYLFELGNGTYVENLFSEDDPCIRITQLNFHGQWIGSIHKVLTLTSGQWNNFYIRSDNILEDLRAIKRGESKCCTYHIGNQTYISLQSPKTRALFKRFHQCDGATKPGFQPITFTYDQVDHLMHLYYPLVVKWPDLWHHRNNIDLSDDSDYYED